MTNFNQVPYPTRAMARPPITTADVGVTIATRPLPNWKALTTSSPAMPANPASGTMIGMVTVARPELEGIKKESGMKRMNRMSTKPVPLRSSTALSHQLSTVSVIFPLFMIAVMPRAIPMMSATPSRSRAPSMNEPVRFVSDRPPTKPTTTEKKMNEAVISGNHHQSVGSPTPMSSHGMTP